MFLLPANPLVVVFRQHTHSFGDICGCYLGFLLWKCGERDLPQAPSYTQPPTSGAIERLRHKLVSLVSQIGVGNWPRLAVVRGLEVIGPQRLFEC